MKEEVEVRWIVNLLNSKYLRGIFYKNKDIGCKRDFERIVGCSENNKEFRKWFNQMVKLEVFEVSDTINNFNYYFVDYSKIIKYLKTNPFFDMIFKRIRIDIENFRI